MVISKHYRKALFITISTFFSAVSVFSMNQPPKMDLDEEQNLTTPKKRIIKKRKPGKKVLSYDPEKRKLTNIRLLKKLKNYTFQSKTEKLLYQKKVNTKNLRLYFLRTENDPTHKSMNVISVFFENGLAMCLYQKTYENTLISHIKNDTFYENTRAMLINEIKAIFPDVCLGLKTKQAATSEMLEKFEKKAKLCNETEKNLFKEVFSCLINDLFDYFKNVFLQQIEYFE